MVLALKDKPVQRSFLSLKKYGTLFLTIEEFIGWKISNALAYPKFPASTVNSKSALVLLPSIFMRSMRTPALSVT